MSSTITGITEQDIANYLIHTPAFFERNAELLSTVKLTSPYGQRSVSLQERQMELLRDKIKGLERKIIEMIRNGQENGALADRLHQWTRAIMLTSNPAELPDVLVNELKHQFLIPHAAVRLWGTDPQFEGLPFAHGVSDDAKSFARSLTAPYCGLNSGFEAARWLDDANAVASVALVPLRRDEGYLSPQSLRDSSSREHVTALGRPDGSDSPAFGLLVLGSPDPTRYTTDMGVDFLMRIGELAGAGLSRLLPPQQRQQDQKQQPEI